MSNYRRLISYIYAYEGGIKGKNIGFAKLEARNGQCKIQVNVRKIYVGNQDTGVYLLSESSEIFLGKIFLRNGAGEFRAVVSVANVAETGRTLDQCYGLTIHSLDDSWQSYTTIWEDAVAHAAAVDLNEATSEQAEQQQMEQIPEARITEKQLEEAVASHGTSVVEELEAEIGLETPPEIMPVTEPDKPQTVPMPIPQPESTPAPASPRPEIQPSVQPRPASTPAPESPAPEMPQPVPAMPEIPQPAPSTGPELVPTPSTEPGLPPASPAPEIAPPMQPQPGPMPIQAESQPVQPETPQPVQPEVPQSVQSELEKQQWKQLEQLEKEETEEEVEIGKLWQYFRRTYPKIQAFDYNGGCEILTIKPQDIGLLPREIWGYGNNSFLLHGYYNHRYLILARLYNPKGESRFLLGVPGHYYSNEKYMASMFGFPNFVLSKMQPSGDGRFGYWYTDIRMS